MNSTCAWCGEPSDGSHAECSEALQGRPGATDQAAFLTEVAVALLEEPAAHVA